MWKETDYLFFTSSVTESMIASISLNLLLSLDTSGNTPTAHPDLYFTLTLSEQFSLMVTFYKT